MFRRQKKKKKFDGKISISPKKVYIAIVLIISLVFIIRSYERPDTKPKGEFGEIGITEIEEFVGELANKDDTSSEEEVVSIESDEEDILSMVPDYSEVNRPAYALNGNKPWFTEAEYKRACEPFIDLSELDLLGRCGTCTASLGSDTLAGERDFDLSHVTPSGWNQAKYDGIDNGGWLYNRCHLIMYAVSGLTDDPRNLVTGTRYMNVKGQLPYAEAACQNYIIRKLGPDGRILYRATPIFKGAELVCRGVHIEAGDIPSTENFDPSECGKKFHINVFCYNVQPGIGIDYLTGNSWVE